jgi:PadR family transcriptional regulator PadR
MRATAATRDVLQVFVAQPDRPHCGVEICEITGLGPGTVYPLLSRLRGDECLVEARQPIGVTDDTFGRPRIWFKLTDKGLAEAKMVLIRRRPARDPALRLSPG